MKKLIPVFLFPFLLLSSCSEQLSNSKILFLAHSLPTSHPVHQGMLFFQEKLAEKSEGELVLKIFPDGQLGSEREVVELLQIGSIAMTKVSAAVMSNFSPEYKVLGVPYLFRDKDHLFNVLEGETGKKILEGGSDYWLRGVCYYDAGSRSFYTKNKPIRTPEDLNGLKIRVMNHQMSVDMVNALGGAATPMSFGELYTALQQGVVDGAENNPPSVVSSNHYEVCKYYTLDEHSAIPDVVLIGTKFWNKMSDQEKKWLQEAADESVVAQKKYWAESVKECFELLDKEGVEIIRPDKSLFVDKSKSVLEEFSKDPKMKKLVEEIQNQ
ncbi:MAG: TRAP transporter substrate-binding protein [Bacteroidetes bacterium]|nr:TRAP transporter substrate-binding protein [Bacteroidota bacterium]